MRGLVAWCVIAGVGCYDPKIDCPARHCDQLVADPPTDSPETPDDGSETVVDASAGDAPPLPPIDARPPPPPIDAPPPSTCAPGCTGTCDDGVCVIACVGTEACNEEVVCPLTGPCRVTCTGRRACKQGVRCGLGRCTVSCQGQDACSKRVRCEAACACDVTCGPDGCKDNATCPHPWCEAGDGCTSTPNGCDAC